ncbi:MAG: hypothetical protein ACOYL6_13740 [Bacteriovoracaceae bacterium]
MKCWALTLFLISSVVFAKTPSSFKKVKTLTEDQMIALMLKYRPVFENYQVGDQREEIAEYPRDCKGVNGSEITKTIMTTLKLIKDQMIVLEEGTKSSCGQELTSRNLVVRPIPYLRYKDLSGPHKSTKNSIFTQLGPMKVESKRSDRRQVVDFSQPGLGVEGSFKDTKFSSKYVALVDTTKIDVTGLKIKIVFPKGDYDTDLLETTKELKDIN